ncbi:pectate lyase [Streptomyces sp. SPB162]|nr:pectate lyase [Streptomyces sp. SPB162]
MESTQHKARHRRRRLGLMIGLPVALTTAVGVTYGAAFGAFGDDAQPKAAAATTTPAWAGASADGFASVNALGQNGTYGGRGGAIVTVRSLADLEKYATATKPYVIVVAGTITMTPKGKEIKVASDKTIVGSGTAGQIVGGGFFLGQGVHNVIIRNLTIRDSYAGTWNDKEHDWDAIQMDGAHHVWIDHNDLRNMADGLIDSRKDTTYLTVSWNRLTHDNKAFGIGWTEHTTADITIHHNWFHETQQRNPSADNVAHAHLYNNFLQDDPGTSITAAYGNYARGRTRMVLENSYFEGLANPVIKDPTAALVQHGNLFVHTSGRNENGGTAFDPKAYYAYTLDPATAVPAKVKSGAGPRSAIGTVSAVSATPSAPVATAPRPRSHDRLHRRQGRLGPVPNRAGRRRRRSGEQRLPDRHRHQAGHLPGDGQDPVEQAAPHPAGHRRQSPGHRHRAESRLRNPQTGWNRHLRDGRQRHRRHRGR